MAWMMYFLFSIGVLGLSLAYGICTPFYLLARVWPPAKNIADSVLQKGIWLLMALQPWLKDTIQLPPSRDLRGKLLVANHRSHLDVFLFLANVPGVRVVAKDSLFRLPFLGFIMRMSYQIPVVRGDMNSYLQSLDIAKDYLKNNETVLIFPEMTRSKEGLKEFRLAPFKMAKEAGAEILPIVIQGTESVWPQKSMKIVTGKKVNMRSLDMIEASGFDTSEELCRNVHQRMAAELR